MANRKPPPHPPDTSTEDMHTQYNSNHSTGSISGAESANELRQFDDIPSTISAALLIHPVLFKVTNDSNAARFLSAVLLQIQIINKKAHLIPKPESKMGEFQLRHFSQKPDNVTHQQFVANFVDGLTATSTQMKGKIWIKSKVQFSTFKKNSKFQEWLHGSSTTPKVRLDRTSLSGTNRYDVGIFLNTVTRFDCIPDFAATYAYKMRGKSQGYEVPEFELDIQFLYRNTTASEGNKSLIRVYRMLTSSKTKAVDLNELMSAVIKDPTDDVSFVPHSIWILLPSYKKDEFHDMQHNFGNTYDALGFYSQLDQRFQGQQWTETILQGIKQSPQ
jgi:hypothetical protein